MIYILLVIMIIVSDLVRKLYNCNIFIIAMVVVMDTVWIIVHALCISVNVNIIHIIWYYHLMIDYTSNSMELSIPCKHIHTEPGPIAHAWAYLSSDCRKYSFLKLLQSI